MSDLFDRATSVFRDFNSVTDSQSGAYEPTKASARALMAVMTVWAEGWVSNIVNAPTGDEADGERYIVGTSPSGFFAAYANYIAIQIDDQWQFSRPPEGAQTLINLGDGRAWQYSNGTWAHTSSATLGLGDASDHPASDFALSTRTVTAGTGLSGGGALTSNVTLSANVGSANINDATTVGKALVTAANAAAARTTLSTPSTARQIIAGLGLSGGGDLSADRTLTADVRTVAGRTGVVTLSTTDISGLGSAALLTTAGVLQPSNNLSEVASATTARTNIGAVMPVTHPSAANLNLQKWLQGGRITTGAPADTLWSDLNDALQEAKARTTSLMVVGGWSLTGKTPPATNAGANAALYLPAGVDLMGHARLQSQLFLASSANCQLLVLEDPSQVLFGQKISGIQFNGQKSLQSSAGGGNSALIELTPTNSATLSRMSFDDIYIRQSYAVSLYTGSFLRATFAGKIGIYQSGAIGGRAALEANGSDSQYATIDVGNCDGAGIFVGGVGLWNGAKTWQCGQVDNANGWGARIASPGVEWHGWSQDCANDGLQMLGTSGSPVLECDITHLSDSDGRYGLNVGNYCQYNFARIRGRKRSGGSYTPSRVVAFNTTNCDHNTINAINDGTGGFTIDPTTPNVGSNVLKILSTPDVWVAVTYAATVTPNAQTQRFIAVTQTGNLTIGTPTAAFNGAELWLKLAQDGTGGRTITLPSNFSVSWTPSTTASKVNILGVRYDETDAKWYQVSQQVGL